MKIDIDQNYIDWIKKQNPEFTRQNIEAYVNEVLSNHKDSWNPLKLLKGFNLLMQNYK